MTVKVLIVDVEKGNRRFFAWVLLVRIKVVDVFPNRNLTGTSYRNLVDKVVHNRVSDLVKDPGGIGGIGWVVRSIKKVTELRTIS